MGFGKVSDFSLKGDVLEHGIDKAFSAARKWAFLGDSSRLENLRASYGAETLRVARNVAQGQRAKYNRCREHVEGFMAKRAYFVTLTFTDGCLASTSAKTRRRYVSRVLKAIAGAEYIANIDYGDVKKNAESNEREHYHAIVVCDRAPALVWWVSNCGHVTVELIPRKKADFERVCRYTAKLSRHALKASTQAGEVEAPRLIYSRGSKRLIPPSWLFADNLDQRKKGGPVYNLIGGPTFDVFPPDKDKKDD